MTQQTKPELSDKAKEILSLYKQLLYPVLEDSNLRFAEDNLTDAIEEIDQFYQDTQPLRMVLDNHKKISKENKVLLLRIASYRTQAEAKDKEIAELKKEIEVHKREKQHLIETSAECINRFSKIKQEKLELLREIQDYFNNSDMSGAVLNVENKIKELEEGK